MYHILQFIKIYVHVMELKYAVLAQLYLTLLYVSNTGGYNGSNFALKPEPSASLGSPALATGVSTAFTPIQPAVSTATTSHGPHVTFSLGTTIVNEVRHLWSSSDQV